MTPIARMNANRKEMKMMPGKFGSYEYWAIRHVSYNRLDGYHEYLEGDPDTQTHLRLFQSRSGAREYISQKHGYMRTRPDLKREPFGWKVPVAVKVTLEFTVSQRGRKNADKNPA